MIDSQQVISTLSEVTTLTIPTLNTLLLMLLCAGLAWLCWQAGSIRPLIYRLWRIITINPPKHDKATQDLLDRDGQIADFRVRTGLLVNTMATVEQLTRWVKTHPNESFATIQSTGSYFDLKNCAIYKNRVHGYKYELVIAFFLMCSVIVLAVALTGASSQNAWLSFKETDTRFIINSKSAHRVLTTDKYQAFTPEKCTSLNGDLTTKTGFSAKELSYLCDFFKEPGLSDWVAENVRFQKRFCVGLTASMLWLMLCFYKEIFSNYAARSMQRRLRQNKPSDENQSAVLT